MISCTQPGARSGSKEPRASGMTSGGGEVAACVSSGNRGVARRVTGSSLPGSRRRMSLSREVFQDTSRGLGQREAFLIYLTRCDALDSKEIRTHLAFSQAVRRVMRRFLWSREVLLNIPRRQTCRPIGTALR